MKLGQIPKQKVGLNGVEKLPLHENLNSQT